MAARQPVPVSRGAAGEPAVTSESLAPVVGDAWCCEHRLRALGPLEAADSARFGDPGAEAGAG